MVEKTAEEYLEDFKDYAIKQRLVDQPYAYVKSLGCMVDTPRELVQLCCFFGAFYDQAKAWGVFSLLDVDEVADVNFFIRHSKFIRPIDRLRRGANTDLALERVFTEIHEQEDNILRAVEEADKFEEIEHAVKRIWSFGDYMALRIAFGVANQLRPGFLPTIPNLSKHTAKGYSHVTGGEKQTLDGAYTLMEKTGVNALELGSFLCDFNKMVNKKGYPGDELDGDLHCIYQAQTAGINVDDMFDVRESLYQPWSRGEVEGWGGIRKPLLAFYHDTGKVWSDDPDLQKDLGEVSCE